MKMITIMADFGGGCYAWLKDDSDETTIVGGLVGDDGGGFWGPQPISRVLQRSLGAWACRFERDCAKPGFDWHRFHRTGLELAKLVKAEVGDSVRVVYAAPCEDRTRPITERTEVMADGRVRRFTVRRPGN